MSQWADFGVFLENSPKKLLNAKGFLGILQKDKGNFSHSM